MSVLKLSHLLVASSLVSAQAADIFSQCRFHFGSDESYAKSDSALMRELDYITGPWTGQSNTFDIGDYYNLCKSNNKVPVNQCYVVAFAARRDQGLQDCNVSNTNNLCTDGANYIRQNRDKILGIYSSYASGVNQIMGSSKHSVWLMEPDFSQYTLSTQNGGGLSAADAGSLMSDIVSTVKNNCPGAVFSMDISPWNDTAWQKDWYGAIGMDKFDFINTSGGSSRADQTFISDTWSTALPTWKWVYQTFKKPMLADAGYGTGGAGTGYDARWDDVNNLTNRINDGVIGIAQLNPSTDWASTIRNNRDKLPKPASCASTSVRGWISCLSADGGVVLSGRTLKITRTGSVQLTLRDIQGKAVFSRNYDGPTSIQVPSEITEGVYLLEVSGDEHMLLRTGFASIR